MRNSSADLETIENKLASVKLAHANRRVGRTWLSQNHKFAVEREVTGKYASVNHRILPWEINAEGSDLSLASL